MKPARLARIAQKKGGPKKGLKKPAAKKSLSKVKTKAGSQSKKPAKGSLAKLATKVKNLIQGTPAAKAKPKAEVSKKKPPANPIEFFFQGWKPKADTFEAGLEKLLAAYPSDQLGPELKLSLGEKISSHMRKQPLPEIIEEQLAERFPRDRIHKISSIWSVRPKTNLRLNILKGDLQGFAESMAAKDLKIKRSSMSPWAFEVGKPEDVQKHPAFQRGLFEFQDEASQLVSLLVNARPGQRILDLSAGEGDHALALSAMMRNKGSLFIFDPDVRKLKTFREKANRAGIDNYRVLGDSQIAEVKSLDTVLIQAPNSELGAIGLHPEIKWKFQREDLPRIQKLQAALLREGARKLKLGGYLIYATHTLNKSENEQQIEHFLKSTHNSYRLVTASSYVREFIVPYVQNFFNFQWDEKTLTSFFEFDPYFLLSPDVHATSGTFVAIIQRIRIST